MSDIAQSKPSSYNDLKNKNRPLFLFEKFGSNLADGTIPYLSPSPKQQEAYASIVIPMPYVVNFDIALYVEKW